jgi:hypothetical protein
MTIEEDALLLRYYCTLASNQRTTIQNLLQAAERAHGVHFKINDLRGQDSEREDTSEISNRKLAC